MENAAAKRETADRELCAKLLGQRLRALRQMRKMTQRELAERAGLPRSNVRRLEAGLHEPRISALLRYQRALGVPWWTLVCVVDGA